MGIENNAGTHQPCGIMKFPSADGSCVRFSCEKWRHTSQRQPMRPLGTGTDWVATRERTVLNPKATLANGDVGTS
jgi:hypothetical protein